MTHYRVAGAALCFCLFAPAALAQQSPLDNLTVERTFDSWEVGCSGQKMESICVAASKSTSGSTRAVLGGLANATKTNFQLKSDGAKSVTIRFRSGEKFTAQCSPLCEFASEELFQLFYFEPKVFADVQYSNGRSATFEWSTNGFAPAHADAKMKWMMRLTR